MKLTNEQALEQAADKLSVLALKATLDLEENPFWRPYEERTNWRDGLVNGFGGPAGDLGGAMHPQVCLAIAESWRQMAHFVREYGEMATGEEQTKYEKYMCEATRLAIKSAGLFLSRL